MKDGDRLKQFIENQPKSKISIARDLKISKQTLFQYFHSKELSKEVKDRFDSYFGKKVFEGVSTQSGAPHEIVSTDQSKPLLERGAIFQVVLNLSYAEKKNSNTMEKMAATNQQNSDMIAALLLELLPNSKFAEKLSASLSRQHEDDDFAIEDELNEEGILRLQEQMQQGKKKKVGK